MIGRLKMNFDKIVKIASLVTAALSMPTMAHADGLAGGTYRLVARVPVACWVRSQDVPAAGQAMPSGSVVEACNSPGGFLVSASYRTLGSDEHATLRYGERVIGLPASGQTVLRQSTMAQIRTVSYAIENASLDQPLVLAFSIQPL
jgi:hypothetical protein